MPAVTIRKGLYLAALILAMLQPVLATTYFVKNGGSDAADGLSDANAWATIAKVNGFTFAAGDSILFKRGGVWREQLTVPLSGTAGNPVTFGDYGTGAKPDIRASDLVTGWTPEGTTNIWQASVTWTPNQVFKNGARGIKEVSKAALTADTEWFYDSGLQLLYFYSVDDPDTFTMEASRRIAAIRIINKSNVTLQNLIVKHADNNTLGNVDVYASTPVSNLVLTGIDSSMGWGYGIQFYDDTGGSYNGITITNCTDDKSGIRPGAQGGIFFPAGPGGGFSNVAITSCTITNAGVHGNPAVATQQGFGIHLDSVTTGTLTDVEVSGSGSSGLNIQGGSNGITVLRGSYHNNGTAAAGDRNGIGIGGIGLGSSNITIEQADIYSNGNSNIEIASTDLDNVMSNVTIKYCRLRNSTTEGLKVGGGHTGQVYMYNLIYGNTSYGYSHTEGTSGSPTALMYGNTIYGNGSTGVYVNGNNLTFKNNIIAENTTLEVNVLGTFTLVSNFNDWYHSAGGTFMQYHAVAYNFADWKTNSAQDANSLSANPLVTNAATNDYTLQKTSPAVGAGTNLGATYQAALHAASAWPTNVRTRNQDANWEIGAYVKSPASPVPMIQ